MIRIAKLSKKEYFRILFKSMLEKNHTPEDLYNRKKKNGDKFLYIFATRLICALVQIELKKSDVAELDKELDLQKRFILLAEMMSGVVNKAIPVFEQTAKKIAKNDYDFEIWNNLCEVLLKIINRQDGVEMEGHFMWTRAAMYLLPAGDFVEQHLEIISDNEDKLGTYNLYKEYSAIKKEEGDDSEVHQCDDKKEIDTMKQLALLLKWEGEFFNE